MKKAFIIILALVASIIIFKQEIKEYIYYALDLNPPNMTTMAALDTYRIKNKELEYKKVDVVFIGNSITDFWESRSHKFFKNENFIFVNRGIGGQSSPQILLRFQQDVVSLKPRAVHISVGTNDISEVSGEYVPQYTLDNIKAMCDIAEHNGIIVMLASVLPVTKYDWAPKMTNIPQKIDALNRNIKKYADEKGYTYIDYNSAMRDANGNIQLHLTDDGVHITEAGYRIMESIVTPTIEDLLK